MPNRPGFKSRNSSENNLEGNYEQMTDRRLAWVDTSAGTWMLYAFPPTSKTADKVESVGSNVQLTLKNTHGGRLSILLSGLTKEELDLARQFLNTALDLAEPLVEKRDEVARDAAERGDESYVRLYRRPPQMVVRQRQIGQYLESIQYGSSDVPGEASGDQASGVRDAGDAVVAGDEGSERPEDNPSQNHERS